MYIASFTFQTEILVCMTLDFFADIWGIYANNFVHLNFNKENDTGPHLKQFICGQTSKQFPILTELILIDFT